VSVKTEFSDLLKKSLLVRWYECLKELELLVISENYELEHLVLTIRDEITDILIEINEFNAINVVIQAIEFYLARLWLYSLLLSHMP